MTGERFDGVVSENNITPTATLSPGIKAVIYLPYTSPSSIPSIPHDDLGYSSLKTASWSHDQVYWRCIVALVMTSRMDGWIDGIEAVLFL